MVTRTQWLSITGLHDVAALNGRAMPFNIVSKCFIGIGIGKQSGPIFVCAQSVSVPISRGSPPISYD